VLQQHEPDEDRHHDQRRLEERPRDLLLVLGEPDEHPGVEAGAVRLGRDDQIGHDGAVGRLVVDADDLAPAEQRRYDAQLRREPLRRRVDHHGDRVLVADLHERAVDVAEVDVDEAADGVAVE